MKSGYSWRDEEGDDWTPDNEDGPPAPGDRRRALLLVVALAGVLFILLFLLAGRRLDEREAAVVANVRAAQATWAYAVGGDDLELFTTLLWRGESDWFMTQRRLFMAGRALRRDALGLEGMPDEVVPVQVNLDPNWRRAEAAFKSRYRLPGTGESVWLRQTQVFRLSGERWQFAPPDERYWGELREAHTRHLSLSYPERDEPFARRFAADMERDMEALCGSGDAGCDAGPIAVDFSTDGESLLALTDVATPALRGRVFVLPAPSLVGLPEDEAAYMALYDGYAARILATVRNNLTLPVALPEQTVALLCSPEAGQQFGLYDLDPASGRWMRQETQQLYRSLQGLPDDSGIILRAGFPGTNVNQLDLTLRRGALETPLLAEEDALYMARLAGIVTRRQKPEELLLSTTHRLTGATTYRLLALDDCAGGVCEPEDLPGFPLWSPDGSRSLVFAGADLFLGDENARPGIPLGRAFSPFWLTAETFGYVRLLSDSDQRPEMEIVLQSATTGIIQPIVRARDLLPHFDAAGDGALRLQYVANGQGNSNVLYVAATPVAPGGEVRFYVVRLRLEGDAVDPSTMTLAEADIIVALDDLPVGDPSLLLPTGYPPFAISPGGRWLVVVQFVDPITDTWRLFLHDTRSGATQQLDVTYPAYPARFPFYDWSEDGQWIVLVDRGYLRLVAPAYDYERIVPHDLTECRYPAWVDRSADSGTPVSDRPGVD